MKNIDKSAMAIEVFNKRANEYAEKYMDVHLYHDTLDIFCMQIEQEGASILELGCGPGNNTKYLLEQRPDFKILATDLAPNMMELAQSNNPSVMVKLLDSREIATLEEAYDAIMCGFCLPYLTKEEALQLIQDAAQVLNANGVLYLSTMENDYEKSGFQTASTGDVSHVYYHEGSYLTEALLAYNFELVTVKRQDFPTQDGTKVTDLIIIARK